MKSYKASGLHPFAQSCFKDHWLMIHYQLTCNSLYQLMFTNVCRRKMPPFDPDLQLNTLEMDVVITQLYLSNMS